MGKRNRSWSLVAVYAGVVGALSVKPVGPEPWEPFPHVDKVLHFGLYLGLAWLLARAMRSSRPQTPGLWRAAWMGASGYGLTLEAIQRLLPWRTGDWADALVNALGAGVGVWLVQHVHRPGARPVETRHA